MLVLKKILIFLLFSITNWDAHKIDPFMTVEKRLKLNETNVVGFSSDIIMNSTGFFQDFQVRQTFQELYRVRKKSRQRLYQMCGKVNFK